MRGNLAPNFPSQEKEVFSLPYFIDKELRLAVKELLRVAEISANLLVTPSTPLKHAVLYPADKAVLLKIKGDHFIFLLKTLH